MKEPHLFLLPCFFVQLSCLLELALSGAVDRWIGE